MDHGSGQVLSTGRWEGAGEAGGENKATTGLPRWLFEANATTRAAALEAAVQRRREHQVHCWVRGAGGLWPGSVLDWRREGARWAALVMWTTGTGTSFRGELTPKRSSP